LRVGFGNYGGLPVKIAYTLLRLALTAVCATETFIWLGSGAAGASTSPSCEPHGTQWCGAPSRRWP
jgi:hypothetical protein